MDGEIRTEGRDGSTNHREGDDDVVLWGDGAMLDAARNGHFDVGRWLCEVTPHDKTGCIYDGVIKDALRAGEEDLVQFLLPPGRCVLDYAADCPRQDVIEGMLDCGYLRRDAELASSAIRDLANTGRLDLMQQIALLHSPLPTGYSSLVTANHWYDALGKACECGDLDALQWLMEYPIEISVWQLSNTLRYRRNPFVLAAGAGHWEIVEHLYRLKATNEFDRRSFWLHDDTAAFRTAIRNGHIKCVEVMVMAFLNAGRRPDFPPVDVAAESGQLGVLKFLLVFHPRGALHQTSDWWSQCHDPISCAAAQGHLDVVKWLHENYVGNNGTDSSDRAARNGHLDVVEWLHANRDEGCTNDAMHLAAINGHLDVVQWLHKNGYGGCRQRTMWEAAGFRHLL